MSSTTRSLLSSTLNAAANHLKPHRAEALQRVRTNAAGLVIALILSYLLPLPTLLNAIRTLFSASYHQRWSSEWWYEWICVLELGIMTLFSYNILEAAYAIKFPRAPLPPVTSPARPKGIATMSQTPKRPFKVLSPNSSPQPQKAFAFSPSSSLTSAGLSLSSSMSGSTTYAPSPVSTPSRVLHYTIPPSASTNTQASSTSTAEYLATPSPVISAYRGKRATMDVGRALDGSYLSRIVPGEATMDE